MATREQAKTERKAFHPIAADVDEVAERVAKHKGIPSLVAPERIRETAVSEPITTSSPGAPPAKSETQVRVSCPDYLMDELCRAALDTQRWGGERVTVNYLVLEALRYRGYHVEEDDLVKDGRRLKKKR